MSVAGNSGFFSTAGQAVDNAVGSVKLNPNQAKAKNGLRGGSRAFTIAAIATGVAAAIFTIIAISVASVGSIFPLALGAFCAFASYNSAQISKNLENMSKNSSLVYQNCFGFAAGINKDRFKKDLSVNTFGVNFLINIFTDEIDKQARANKVL